MSRFHTVGARLSLALLVVVAVALGVGYLIVVPSLRSRLVDSKVSQLERAVAILGRDYLKSANAQLFADNAAETFNARVIVFQPFAPSPPTLVAQADSSQNSSDVTNDPIALEAASSARGIAHGTVERNGDRYAEAALRVPVKGSTLLVSAPLHDALSSVHLVQRRILLAGLLALLVALLMGYGGASMFARRIRRLERSAEQIAAGHFDAPVTDEGRDELGELSRAFDRMRVRLARLDHARREFVANASHELRTPLFSLGGFLELLTDEELNEETRREFLETMAEQVRRLTKLADDLLDLSRLDAGRIRLERRRLDLAALGGSVVDEFAAVARAHEHPLELAADGPVVAVGDEQRVLQIGRVLVENALVHTPPETNVRVYARREGGEAVLAVQDDGPGIPPEHAEHLFERFYRIDGAKASGSGLGLAIARELAEAMGGRIELESAPGRTVFSLVLPVDVPDRREVEPEPAAV